MVNMGGWCIDTTEVTQAHYAAFLAAKGTDTSNQVPACKNNSSFDPSQKGQACAAEYQPSVRPDDAVSCIDWCDAAAYCAWAGKRLCGNTAGGPLDDTSVLDPTKNQYLFACSNGGLTKWPYGNLHVDGKCSWGGNDPVKSAPGCHGMSAPFSEVYDLVGNAAEWIDYCPTAASCAKAGNVDEAQVHPTSDPLTCPAIEVLNLMYVDTASGFRCCSL